MASTEIALVCGLKSRMGCQERLCMNLDADETLAKWKSRKVSKVQRHSCRRIYANSLLYNFLRSNMKLQLQIAYLQTTA